MRWTGAPRRSLLGLVLAAAACRAAPGPEQVLDAYLGHLRAGRVAEAYALTTPAYRARTTLAAFALRAARQPLVERAERGATRRETLVELVAPGQRPVRLLDGGAGLLLVDDPLDLYPADTPEAALRSFARAVELDRRAQLTRLLSPALRDRVPATAPLPEAVVEAAHAIGERLRAPLGPLVSDGATSRWLIGEGRFIALEHGPAGWWLSSL